MTSEDVPQAIARALEGYGEAVQELHLQNVTAALLQRPGLSYASIGDERTGPHLVAYNGELIGRVWTTSPGVFRDWHSAPLEGDVSERGPFVSARAAAVGLLQDGPKARQVSE